MKRRDFIIGASLAALGGTWLLRPKDEGAGGHSEYFRQLSATLDEHRLARPTMIVDLDRMDRNVDRLTKAVAPRSYRIVAKSLPSAPLIDYVMQRGATNRLMVFHQPFLNEVASKHPRSDVLIGKPLPVAAADRFYSFHKVGGFAPDRQLQWLIDTPERLAEYSALARGRGLSISVNIEIDVGLHRGGLRDPEVFVKILKAIDADANLRFGGLMGYDPHVVKIPNILGTQGREFERVQRRYLRFVDAWKVYTGGTRAEEILWNAAGSPTINLWAKTLGIANDLAAGSALVKPSDFDLHTLEGFEPALWISTPVLKRQDGVDIPVYTPVGRAQEAWDPNRQRTFFVYGGYWKAYPYSPPGLSTNPTYGHSTNQEMLNGSRKVDLKVGDYVFLRPTQSEFVMLQFGDIAIVRDGKIVDFAAPFAQTA